MCVCGVCTASVFGSDVYELIYGLLPSQLLLCVQVHTVCGDVCRVAFAVSGCYLPPYILSISSW